MRRLGIVLGGIVMIALTALVFSSCGDDDNGETDSPTTTQTATASPTGSATSDEEAVSEAVDDVFSAIRDKDRDRLRDRTGQRLRDQVRDQDYDRLMECYPQDAEITVISREVEVSGDTATVTVTFEITQDGETSQVERVWGFELADDGTWVLTEFPDCPFD